MVHLDGTTLGTEHYYTDYLRVCIDNQLLWKEKVKKVTGREYRAVAIRIEAVRFVVPA